MKNNKVIFVLNMVSPSVAAIFKLRYCVLMKHEKNIENIYSNSVFNSSLKSQPEMAPPYLRKKRKLVNDATFLVTNRRAGYKAPPPDQITGMLGFFVFYHMYSIR